MRNDATSLLIKLGRRDFSYREFVDQFGDMELWPIFEAMLHDPRVVGKSVTRLEARRAETSALQPGAQVQAAQPHLSTSDVKEASQPPPDEDVLAFIKRFNA